MNVIKPLENIDAIAFDWDGVIVDTLPKVRQNQALAAKFGNYLTELQVRSMWGASGDFWELMHNLCPGVPDDAIMAAVKSEYNNPEYAKHNIDGNVEALLKLRELGIPLAVATSGARELFHTDARDLGIHIDSFFEFTQAAEDSPEKKPSGAFLTPTLRHFGVTAERLLYIGDENKDYFSAVGAGVQFLGVESGINTARDFDEIGTRSIKDITYLVEV